MMVRRCRVFILAMPVYKHVMWCCSIFDEDIPLAALDWFLTCRVMTSAHVLTLSW